MPGVMGMTGRAVLLKMGYRKKLKQFLALEKMFLGCKVESLFRVKIETSNVITQTSNSRTNTLF